MTRGGARKGAERKPLPYKKKSYATKKRAYRIDTSLFFKS